MLFLFQAAWGLRVNLNSTTKSSLNCLFFQRLSGSFFLLAAVFSIVHVRREVIGSQTTEADFVPGEGCRSVF